MCAKQNMALRGHRESAESSNRGNFLANMDLIANHDSVIKEKLHGQRNAVYTSPQIQNHLLQLMGNAVRQRVIKAVQEATVFAILADETKDVNKIEQLSIAVRYVDIGNASVYERFLTYVPTENQTAEGISGYILDTLECNNLNPKTIVAQGYDGAAVMSGSSSGVQTRIKAVAPYAMYIHCNAHCLNLCLIDCVKVVYSASELFSIVQNLYTSLYPGKQHRQLQRLSDTRWACRQSAINAICYRFDAIIGTLVEVVNGNDGAKAAEANGILLQVKSFKFILCLVIFDQVLSCSKGLSDVLQSTHLDLGKAADLVTSTIQTLEQFRTDDEWEKVLTYSHSVADVHGVSPCKSSTRPSRNPRPPRRFESDIITGTTGCRVESTLDGYKIDLYFSVLDAFLSELKRRFSDKNRDIMRSLQACCPSSDSFLSLTI